MNRIVTLLFLLTVLNGPAALCQNSFKIPSENWSLEIDLGDYKIDRKQLSRDKTSFQLSAMDKKTLMNLTLFIEKAPLEGDKLACRDYYWSKAEKSPLQKENVQLYEVGDLALVEHDVREFGGRIINFHNLNAYLVNGDYWIDVHMSKIGYTESDKELFEKVWRSISIKANN